MDNKEYLNLDKLEVYLLSRELSRIAWEVHQNLTWQAKKINGDQFVESTDSTGANIAEGYGRYHYLDKIKFYYNARASMKESRHWFEILLERKMITCTERKKYLHIYAKLSPKLNAFISVTYKNKTNKKS
ncbi:MAG: four helix bundle protein [Patescibacteria group bacterium]|nr:four helix bundle protein [Patescibacteria group bacterium]